MNPHTLLLNLFREKLPGWNIRHGDSLLDGNITQRTAIVYTEELENQPAVNSGKILASLKVIVFTPEVRPDKLESALFETLTDVISVLDSEISTLYWSNARRGVWQARPGYEIDIKIAIQLEKKEEN